MCPPAHASGVLCSPAQACAACTALHALHTHCLCTHTLLTLRRSPVCTPRQDVLHPPARIPAHPTRALHAPLLQHDVRPCPGIQCLHYTRIPAHATCVPRRGHSGHRGVLNLGVFPSPLSPSPSNPKVTMAMQGEPPAPWFSRPEDPKGSPAVLQATHPVCPKEDPVHSRGLSPACSSPRCRPTPSRETRTARAVPLTPPRCCSQAWATG